MKTTTAPSMQFADETVEPVGRSLKRVLVAVDRFDTQGSAAKLGAALAREHDAEVRVVHVTERQVSGRARFELETPEEARQLVEDAVSEIKRQGVEASGHVVRAILGHAAQAILAEAANFGADEIVIGAKRSGSIFGRRTRERLFRHSSLPVVVAPRPSEQLRAGVPAVELGRRHAA
ncbi:MAG: universal stress protein [Acidimicrobiales bacterium]|jgi:nucleotide-binding universal stress UspA family protein